MNPRLRLHPLAAVPAVLIAATLTGCPDTSEDLGTPPRPPGKLTLVQTLVATDDPDVTDLGNFVLSAGDDKIYVTSWHGNVLTFDRSPVDGSLARAYAAPVFNASGLAITSDGAHLYAVGANSPNQLVRLDIDAVTGEPVLQKPSILVQGAQLGVAAHGAFLYETSLPLGAILSYRIAPGSGALTPGISTPYDSPSGNGVLFGDDEDGALFATAMTPEGGAIVRYAVDAATGALAKVGETPADFAWGYVMLARCAGTTRMYVAQDAGNIGYADIGGGGIAIPASFAHPDLVHARSATLSPDCKTLYAVTQHGQGGSLVVLARDDAGDLSWLQTIPMGPGTPIDVITQPWYALTSADGRSVYVASQATGEGLVVLRRDTTGAP
jgi:6-phosphogluconolactonase (cycloisomerase 2 family)